MGKIYIAGIATSFARNNPLSSLPATHRVNWPIGTTGSGKTLAHRANVPDNIIGDRSTAQGVEGPTPYLAGKYCLGLILERPEFDKNEPLENYGYLRRSHASPGSGLKLDTNDMPVETRLIQYFELQDGVLTPTDELIFLGRKLGSVERPQEPYKVGTLPNVVEHARLFSSQNGGIDVALLPDLTLDQMMGGFIPEVMIPTSLTEGAAIATSHGYLSSTRIYAVSSECSIPK